MYVCMYVRVCMCVYIYLLIYLLNETDIELEQKRYYHQSVNTMKLFKNIKKISLHLH